MARRGRSRHSPGEGAKQEYRNTVIGSTGPWTIFDYVTEHGRNAIADWSRRLEVRDRAILDEKLDTIERDGPSFTDGTWEIFSGKLRKLRVRAERKQLRPVFCLGPLPTDVNVLTMLLGLEERDNEYVPLKKPQAIREAVKRMKSVIADPKSRRTLHE